MSALCQERTLKRYDNFRIIHMWKRLLRDGMYLELSVSETCPLRQVAEVFYSDVT